MEYFTRRFADIGIKDIAEVGGKNASLGEMFSALSPKGVQIPDGFAVTAAAFRYFLDFNKLGSKLHDLMQKLDRKEFLNLSVVGGEARALILQSQFPPDLRMAICDAYDGTFYFTEAAVAVRSSATAEDLPNASFAGQHESYLNIAGHSELLDAVMKCYASLYTDRAIKYREDKGFKHDQVYLSVGVQLMVRADKACSGVGFTLEPESGFRDIIHIAGVWGLGENIVQGAATPDEFLLFKPSLKKGLKSIIQKNIGSKARRMVYGGEKEQSHSTVNQDTPWELREKFVITDQEAVQLANWGLIIEEHYKKPMDFEWAKDGVTGQLAIIQARPETVHSLRTEVTIKQCHIAEKGKIITSGEAVGNRITCGPARIINSPADAAKLHEGDILVTDTTSPDWDPILKKVAGIVTNKGGRTSHAAIIARELGAVAIVGTENATVNIQDGDMVTLSCAEGKTGFVYEGKLAWHESTIHPRNIHLPEKTKAQLIIGDPEKAFELSFLPNDGVGLMRLEFIIANRVKVHPMALVRYNAVTDEKDRVEIENLTRLYTDKTRYFVDQLSQGVATIAAAFYPKEVIVRMSDFKTNEYAGLLGGRNFEPEEQNPMLGFRGASRYYHERYRDGFRLECEAMKVVRDEMGLNNIKLMVPFCRTVEEGKKVVALMETFGLKRGVNGLEIFVMAEIPSNVLLAKEFAEVFDGFSIGSNDLTQLTLGIDRDSSLIAGLFDEQNEATKNLINSMIQSARRYNRKIGLCGQAPSDSASFTQFLVDAGINSIAFNPDALVAGIRNIQKAIAKNKALEIGNELSEVI